ncbi:MAG TPA: hypothetical protein VL371_15895 [Gemmataceae bacterium]|jgi:hypothetical protein|nr:hypothetical protein [Gemmataceae bacterium]
MSTANNSGDFDRGNRTLGEAANRWVTWQIIFGMIGLALFLLFLFVFFIPMWRSFPVP